MLRPTVCTITVLLAACGGESSPTKADPAAAVEAISPKVPVDPYAAQVADVQDLPFKHGVMEERIELGKMLFFDPRLSGSGNMSCSTCHLPEMAWTDGKKVSPKDDGTKNKRNTPTLVNVGYLEQLYWDGRAPNLQKNILAAWQGQMGAKDTAAIADRLAAVADYAARFTKLYKGKPTEATIVEALMSFVRMQRGDGAPYDLWRAGNQDAVGPAAKAGYAIFMGKGGCAVCHQEPLFTDKVFHNAGVGMDAEKPDLGRGAIVADPKLDGWFKTPTLRDVARTAPYFHDGSVATLEEAVRFMASGGRDNPTRSPEMIDRKLTDEEISQVVAFLQTLTSSAAFMAPQLPK